MDFEIIRTIIAEKMDVEPAAITPESTLDDLKIDSLDMVEIVMSLEEELNISLDNVENIATLQDLVNFIAAQK